MGLQKPTVGMTDQTLGPNMMNSASSMKPAKLPRKPSILDPEQIVKQLIKYCHSNSSQFAVIICDAEGQITTRASSAFTGYLDQWIPNSVRESASQVAISAAGEKAARRRRRDSGIEKRSSMLGDSNNGGNDAEGWTYDDGSGMKMGGFIEGQIPPPPPDDLLAPNQRKRPGQDDGPMARKKKTVARPERDDPSESPEMIIEAPVEDYKPLTIGDEKAVGTFYMTRLRQMQQLMCRIVAKAWIKVIEPKKQSNFPYNRGEESKPSWWPEKVKHKEPDHLLKHERLTLLLTMIRYRKIEIAKLEQATAEVMAQIPTNKDREKAVPLLEEIYRVAKQEERLRNGEISPDTVVFVAASETIIKSPTQKVPSPKVQRSSLGASQLAPQERRPSTHSQPPPPHDLGSVDEGSVLPSPENTDIGSLHRQPPPPPPPMNSYTGPSHIPPPLQNIAYPSYQGPDLNQSPIVTSPYLEDTTGAIDYYSIPEPSSRHHSGNYGQPSLLPHNHGHSPVHRRPDTIPNIPNITHTQPPPHSGHQQPPIFHNSQWPSHGTLQATGMVNGMMPPYSPTSQPVHSPFSTQANSAPATPATSQSYQLSHQQPPLHHQHHGQHQQGQMVTSAPPPTNYGTGPTSGIFTYSLEALNGPSAGGGHGDGRCGIK